MTDRSGVCRLLCMAAVLAAGGAEVRADWPNFRGPRHDGISDEKGFNTAWTEPIPLVWESEVGAGFSSFACVGDRVYTCGTLEGQQTVFCLKADTGEVLWQTPLEKEYQERAGGDGTRATPTVDDGRVYVLGALGRLVCLGADGGAVIWEKQFHHVPRWGYSGSVLIEGDLAIVSAGVGDGALVAFDKVSGKQAWKCGDDPVGYATPYPFTFEGTRYIVGFTAKSAIVAEAATGRQVWRTAWKTDWEVNAASPIFHDGHLFLSSGYQTGSALFKMRKSGDGLDGKEVWRSKVLMNKFQSCILHDGHLYSSDQKALVCVEFLTGKEQWRKHRVKHGTLVFADGHLLLLTQDGQLQIAKATPEAFSATTTADILSGRCWTVSVLHKGKLYARNLKRVTCFDMALR